MTDLLTCPIDQTPLVLAADDGVFETTCHECRRAFRFTRGRLKSAERDANAGRTKLELCIDSGDELVVIHDEVRAERWKQPRQSKPITTIEQFDRKGGAQLVSVHSGSGLFEPHEPGDRALIRATGRAVRGALVTIFATLLVVYFYHWVFVLLLPLLGFFATAVVAWLTWRASTTRQVVDAEKLGHLKREQWLLSQLQRYRLQSDDLRKRLAHHEKQIATMRSLRDDMVSASGDYEHRIVVMERGIDAIQLQVDNEIRLRDTIERAVEMVQIEYRASRALDHLPQDVIGRMSSTIEELDAIESENVMLEAQLEADAEVQAIAPN